MANPSFKYLIFSNFVIFSLLFLFEVCEASRSLKNDNFENINSPYDFERLSTKIPRGLSHYSRSLASRSHHSKIKRNHLGRMMVDGSSCAAPLTSCGINCVDLKSSNVNCGACSKLCPASSTCCAGVCVDLSSDNANCGECGKTCTAECVNSMCGY